MQSRRPSPASAIVPRQSWHIDDRRVAFRPPTVVGLFKPFLEMEDYQARLKSHLQETENRETEDLRTTMPSTYRLLSRADESA